MDGLSAAASVIAVIQICGSLLDVCRTYYTGVRDARKDITRLRNGINRLEDVLTSITDLADADDSARLAMLQSLVKPNSALTHCRNDLSDLLEKLKCSQDHEGMRRFGWRALTWPLKSKDVDKALADIERHKSLFTLALTADATTLNLTLNKALDGVTEKLDTTFVEVHATRNGVVSTLAVVKAIQSVAKEEKRKTLIKNISTWLTHADPATSHQAASRKRQNGTGQWLLNGVRFREWKRSRGSFLWLFGIPGCGKTILASTAIDHVKEECCEGASQALAYFYFEFNDPNKQSAQNCLTSVVAQLCASTKEIPTQLEDIYERCGHGRSPPSVQDLVWVIEAYATLESIGHIYVILDALDECPTASPEDYRAEMLGAIRAIQRIYRSNIHLLVTSRQEIDIQKCIKPLVSLPPLSIQDAQVNDDIQNYVRSQLASDPKLSSWSADIQLEVEHTLVEKASGMFRWVYCQLDALKKAKKKSSILLALKQLPKTLDETYERMLAAIDEVYREEARRALMWLAFSERPLSAEEVAEAACIDPDADPPFNEDDRFQDPRNNILEVLGSLVSLVPGDRIQLAHFSVKEYLLSNRLLAVQSAHFRLTKSDAELHCAQSCLAYLLQDDNLSMKVSEMPFINYACVNWPAHVQHLGEDDVRVRPLVRLLYSSEEAYGNWQGILDAESPLPGIRYGPQQKTLSPLCHASAMGFTSVVEEKLSQQGLHRTNNCKGRSWTPLHTAAICGRARTVAAILKLTKQNPILDVLSPNGSTALQLASANGFLDVVSLLLDYGALVELTAPGGSAAIALAAAVGHLGVVKLLLEHEARLGQTLRQGENALFAAIRADSIAIVEKLIEYGVRTEIVDANGSTPLLLTIANGQTQISRILLNHGTDPNRVDSFKSTPLHRAVQKGERAAVELLLQHKADVTLGDTDGKTPFHYACAKGDPFIIKAILETGINIAMLDGWNKMPIHYAAWCWNPEAVQILLDNGADLEAKTPRGETPLQLAAQRGGDCVVECLLKNGADITTRNANGKTVLHFAAVRANRQVLQHLLKYGADPRIRDNRGLTPLQAYNEYEANGTGRYIIRRVG
ncbi:ankyrin repeat-containing domain protein [Trichoderma ceciliae]